MFKIKINDYHRWLAIPQSRLIDVNTAWIKHRNEVITSLKSANYDSVLGSIYAINGLLPDSIDEKTGLYKYRIIFSDQEYEKAVKPTINVICYNCGNEFIYETLKFYNRRLSFKEQCITQKIYEKVWSCPKCDSISKLKKTKMQETKLKEPYYLGIAPKPPKMLIGLGHRSKFHAKMRQWILSVLAELEAKMALYRDDYLNREEVEFERDYDVEGGEQE